MSSSRPDPLDLPDVTDEELAEALAQLNEADLRQQPDHPYKPDQDPYADREALES